MVAKCGVSLFVPRKERLKYDKPATLAVLPLCSLRSSLSFCFSVCEWQFDIPAVKSWEVWIKMAAVIPRLQIVY